MEVCQTYIETSFPRGGTKKVSPVSYVSPAYSFGCITNGFVTTDWGKSERCWKLPSTIKLTQIDKRWSLAHLKIGNVHIVCPYCVFCIEQLGTGK